MWLPLFYSSVLFSIFVRVKDVVYRNSLGISLDSYQEYQQPVEVSPHASGYYTFERLFAEMCSRDVILELRSVRWQLSAQVRSTVERAGCGRTCRGRRAGKHIKARRHCIAYNEVSDGEIPVVSTTSRRRSNSSAGRVAVIVIDEMSFCDASHSDYVTTIVHRRCTYSTRRQYKTTCDRASWLLQFVRAEWSSIPESNKD